LQSRVSCFYEYEMLPDFSFSTEINQLWYKFDVIK
jgi:hypothetical protein